MRQIVFDLETTGFKYAEGHRIVEIGAIELINGAVTGRDFHSYVNPERDMPEGAYRVHGLSEAFLRNHPVFADARVAPAFCEFIGDAQLIAHNGEKFDLPFLQAELEGAGLARLSNDLIDTLHLARRKHPGAPASLDALCQRFGVDLGEREREGHGALLDSKLLATIYVELTGGAQAGLDLVHHGDERAQTASAAGPKTRRDRAAPLPSRLSSAEAERHAAFVAELGENAIWREFDQ